MTGYLDPRYWAWWKDKLAGVNVPASESTPYAGFYRWIRKTGYGSKKYAVPVAYWPGGNGELNCREGFKDVTPERGRDIWVQVHANPVAEDWYRDVAEKDYDTWRDGMSVSPPMGDNAPPSEIDFEWLNEQIKPLSDEANARINGPPITEQVEADQIGNLADRLAELWKHAEEARKAERKPHDDAIKEIQVKWAPLTLMAEAFKQIKYKLLTPWQTAQEKALKKEAEAAAAAGEPIAAPEARRSRAGTRGRAMTLRTFKHAEIVDFDLALTHFKGHDDIRTVVQDLANKSVRVGIEVPGCKVIEEKRTV